MTLIRAHYSLAIVTGGVFIAIMDNRVRLNSANGIGSREWWKIINAICTYKTSSRCTLSEAEN